MDIPSQFSPRALPGDAERCLAFRIVVKGISHEENQQVRQRFNRHRSRSPILDNDGRYASAGARERFLQYLALNHRADLAKAGFTGRQIGQMADLRPFDPRADNVIWQVHHKIPIQVSGLLKDPNDFKNLVFLPEHDPKASGDAAIARRVSREVAKSQAAKSIASSLRNAHVVPGKRQNAECLVRVRRSAFGVRARARARARRWL